MPSPLTKTILAAAEFEATTTLSVQSRQRLLDWLDRLIPLSIQFLKDLPWQNEKTVDLCEEFAEEQRAWVFTPHVKEVVHASRTPGRIA